MGVPGLLALLKQQLVPTNVSALKGSVAAVDISVWMHAVLGNKRICSYPLSILLNMILDRINQLLGAEIVPVIIFDGSSLPAKSATAEKRARIKNTNLHRAAVCVANNDPVGAAKYASRATTRIPEMTNALIKRLKESNIPFVVAPYEADAQIAFMLDQGVADLVVTVDSDFVLYGCCKRILYKMDKNGDGLLYQQEEVLTNLLGSNFDLFRFRWCSILVGCDYFDGGIKGIGIQKLAQIYADTEGISDVESFIKHIVANQQTTSTFDEDFMRAEQTFRHQVVFDVKNECNVHLTPLPEETTSSDISFVGSLQNSEKVTFELSALDPSAPLMVPVIKNLYDCIRCHEHFDTRAENVSHWKEAHSLFTTVNGKRKWKRGSYKCSTCGIIVTRMYGLQRHMSTVHDKLLHSKCKVCFKRFRDAQGLEEHMGFHNMNVKSYPCTHCTKVFKYASGLNQHLKWVNNERKFSCGVCGQRFNIISHLRVHEQTHLSPAERPRFQCEQCPANFAHNEDLTRHTKEKHTNPKIYVCAICLESGARTTFAYKRGVDKHYKRFHPNAIREYLEYSS